MDFQKAKKLIDKEFSWVIKEEKVLRKKCDAISKKLKEANYDFINAYRETHPLRMEHIVLTKKFADLYPHLIKSVNKVFEHTPPGERTKVVLYLRRRFNETKKIRKEIFEYSKKCIEQISPLVREDIISVMAILDTGLLWRRTGRDQFFNSMKHKALRPGGFRGNYVIFSGNLSISLSQGGGDFVYLVRAKHLKKVGGRNKEIVVYQSVPASEWEAIYVLDKNILEQARIIAKKHGINCPIKYNRSEMERINNGMQKKAIRYFKHYIIKYKPLEGLYDKVLKEYKYSDKIVRYIMSDPGALTPEEQEEYQETIFN